MAAQTRVDDDSPLIDSLKRIAVRIPSASWWIFFDPTSTSSQQHIWLRVPDSVRPITRIADVLTNREPKLQQDSCIIGQLNVLHWGTSCLIADEQITPSNSDQIICVEIVTTQKDGDRLVFWTDIRRPELLCLMGSRVSRIGVNGPTRLTPGTVIGGWISGCQYDSAEEVEERGLTLRQEAFLIPVDFQDSLKLYVVLLPSEETNGSTESPQEYNLMNGCSSPVSSIQTSAASFTRIRVLVENRMGCGDGVQMVGEHSIQTSGELADISASYEVRQDHQQQQQQ
ncbi:unnamed protein product [Schistocephalus solidus]|uniref:REPA_OB_2 domain-containing protein n=1 Tax=Schistocephalus solidus TaxID=70667 RepID=A0A183ST55_SCHSO|nr:unnamed protein product [Schistocephalus solidus]